MSTPKRGLEDSETRGLERTLLEAGASLSLSTERRGRLWQSIAAQLPPPGTGSGPEPGGPASPPAGPTTAPAGASASAPATPPADSAATPIAGGSVAPPPATGAVLAGKGAAIAPAAGPPSVLAASGAKGAIWVAALGLTALAGYWFADPIGLSPRPAVSRVASVPVAAVAPGQPVTPTPGASGLVAVAAPPGATVAARPEVTAAPGGGRRDAAGEASPRGPADPGSIAVGAATAGATAAGAPATSATAAAEAAVSAAPTASVARELTPAEVAAQERANRLREEADLTRSARSALRAGNPGEALRLLEQARVTFGGGGLGQEREALTIEALGRSGQGEQARARAEAFLRAYPASPHAPDVQRFAR